MNEYDDPILRSALADPQFVDFALRAQSVAMKNRFRETYLVPTKVADSRAQCRVMDRDPDHQSERKYAVDDALTELGLTAAVFLVQMQRRRVVGQRRKKHIIRLRDRSPDGMYKPLSDSEFFEIESCHCDALALFPRHPQHNTFLDARTL